MSNIYNERKEASQKNWRQLKNRKEKNPVMNYKIK